MTEGFIKTTGTIAQMEYIAHGYFDELVSCSFMQTGKYTNSNNENESLRQILTQGTGTFLL